MAASSKPSRGGTAEGDPEPCRLRKRSVVIAGHRTSVSLEDAFWDALMRIANRNGESVSALITRLDRTRTANLSSTLRVFVLGNTQREAAGGDPTS